MKDFRIIFQNLNGNSASCLHILFKLRILVPVVLTIVLSWNLGKLICNTLHLNRFLLTLPGETQELLTPYFYLVRDKNSISKNVFQRHRTANKQLTNEDTRNGHKTPESQNYKPSEQIKAASKTFDRGTSDFLNFTHFEAKYQQLVTYFHELDKLKPRMLPNRIPAALQVAFRGQFFSI